MGAQDANVCNLRLGHDRRRVEVGDDKNMGAADYESGRGLPHLQTLPRLSFHPKGTGEADLLRAIPAARGAKPSSLARCRQPPWRRRPLQERRTRAAVATATASARLRRTPRHGATATGMTASSARRIRNFTSVNGFPAPGPVRPGKNETILISAAARVSSRAPRGGGMPGHGRCRAFCLSRRAKELSVAPSDSPSAGDATPVIRGRSMPAAFFLPQNMEHLPAVSTARVLRAAGECCGC